MTAPARPPPSLTFDALMSDARALARPCVRLSVAKNRRGPVGRWEGPPSRGSRSKGRHLLSFDLGALPPEFSRLGLSGCASVHERVPGAGLRGELVITRRVPDWTRFPTARGYHKEVVNPFNGEPMGVMAFYDDLETRTLLLYAWPHLSLPYLTDLCTYGSPRVARYLEESGAFLEQWKGGSMPEGSPVKEYLDAWELNAFGPPGGARTYGASFAGDGTAAVLGGWYVPIAYSYCGPPPDGRFLLSTLGGDPWHQVWIMPSGGFEVQEIIT